MFIAYLREVDQQQELLKNDIDMTVRRRALLRVQQALISAQEIGDEKLQIVQQIQDLIENKARQLDLDYRNLGKLFYFYVEIFLYLSLIFNNNAYRLWKRAREQRANA